VTVEQTSKKYKTAQLFGVFLILFGVVSWLYQGYAYGGGYRRSVLPTLMFGCGFCLYLYGRFAAWWNNG